MARTTTKKKAPAKKPTTKKTTTRKAPASKKPTSRRRPKGTSKLSVMDALMSAALGTAGAIAVSFVLAKLPKKDGKSIIPDQIAPLAPVLAGVGALMVPAVAKNKMLQSAALGALVYGGVTAVKRFVPSIPLAGDDDGFIIPPALEQAAMLGYDVGSQGVNLGDEYDSDLGAEIQLGDDDDSDEISGDDAADLFA